MAGIPVLRKKNDLTHNSFKYIQTLLYNISGINIPDHKQSMVKNRISKRVQALKLACEEDYVTLLNSDAGEQEIGHLINALTTNVTHFFREEHHFKHLQAYVYELAEKEQKKIRLWSAACSIGAEPYSAAMMVQEALQQKHAHVDVRILATDIDTNALEHARNGAYGLKSLKGLPKHFQFKYFNAGATRDAAITIKPFIRNLVSFNYMNFNNAEWPMSGPFDAIFCRNALIYFDSQKREEFVCKFIRLLRPGGFLYLGHSENAVMTGKPLKICGPTIYQKESI